MSTARGDPDERARPPAPETPTPAPPASAPPAPPAGPAPAPPAPPAGTDERRPPVRADVRRTAAAAASVGVFAVAVSAVGSWIPSLWGDEAASLLSATRPLGSLLHMLTRVDAVHGLSYVMLHVWIRIAGSSPFALRFPSAVAIGACAAIVVWMCRRFGGLAFAVTAGVLTAILPQLTDAGEEARSYPFDAALAALLCAIVVEIAVRRHVSRRWWVAYAVTLTVAVYAFLYTVLMVPAVAVMVALTPRLRARWRRFAKASAFAVLAASPIIAAGLIEHSQIAFLSGRDRGSAYDVLVAMWFWRPDVAAIGWSLIVVAAVGWGVDAARTRGASPAPALRGETVAFAWLVVPVGLLLLSNAVVADFTSRYGTFAAPAAAVAMALGLRRLAALRIGSRAAPPADGRAPRPAGRRARWPLAGIRHARGTLPVAAAVLAAAALVAAIVPVWAAQRGPYAKNDSDWNDIAAAIAHDARPGDGIVFDEAARPSRSPRLAMDTNPAPFRGLRDVTLKTPYARSALWYGDAYGILQAAARGRFDGVRRVWLVDTAFGTTPSTWGRRPLQQLGYRVVRRIRLHSSELLLYQR